MFIVFEGVDGSSKTTQVKILEQYLTQKNIKNSVIKEPGSTDLGEQCRTLLLQGGLDKRSELALFFAARADNVNKNILVRKNTEYLICDRYVDSTVAYQCYANQSISEKELKPMLDFFSYGVKPNITFILDVDYEVAVKRLENREKNHYDTAGREYFQSVQTYYRSLMFKESYYYIDTTKLDIQTVHNEIVDKICSVELKIYTPPSDLA